MIVLKNIIIFFIFLSFSFFLFAGESRKELHNLTIETEKCYGIAKAGKNDCNIEQIFCKSSINDGDPDAFLFVPKGLCLKIRGGSLKDSNPL